MILGEGPRPDPVFQLHPWRMGEENRVPGHSNGGDFASYALSEATVAALRQFLAGNEPYGYLERRRIEEEEDREEEEENDTAVDAYSCDEFRMYEFKVRRCVRGRSHDWTECPYAHPGEKARRRDPRKFNYSGVACPDFRKGACKRGDACEYAHGVFECWLHPSRYRTQACKDGTNCRRRVCFFAHTPDQLRAAPQQPQSPPPASPPMSPISGSPINDIFSSMRRLHLSKANSVPSSWGLGSPRGINAVGPGFCSLPATPTAASPTPLPLFDDWSEPTERVESGRSLRVKIYGKLSREFSMRRGHEEDEEATAAAAAIAPDVGWVSDLLM